MTLTFRVLLLLVAIVCFVFAVLAADGTVAFGKVDCTDLGLAFGFASFLPGPVRA